jgi:predicted transcriptional regulator
MTFGELQKRFILHLRSRIRNGELTERGLARLTGISQPHIHNVLKGHRSLSPDLADVILTRLNFDLMDLIHPDELLAWRRDR